MPTVTVDQARFLVGMLFGPANDAATARGWILRPVSDGGSPFPIPDDGYHPNRVNVAMDLQTIVGIVSVG